MSILYIHTLLLHIFLMDKFPRASPGYSAFGRIESFWGIAKVRLYTGSSPKNGQLIGIIFSKIKKSERFLFRTTGGAERIEENHFVNPDFDSSACVKSGFTKLSLSEKRIDCLRSHLSSLSIYELLSN